jgi:hypothetical protein
VKALPVARVKVTCAASERESKKTAVSYAEPSHPFGPSLRPGGSGSCTKLSILRFFLGPSLALSFLISLLG